MHEKTTGTKKAPALDYGATAPGQNGFLHPVTGLTVTGRTVTWGGENGKVWSGSYRPGAVIHDKQSRSPNDDPQRQGIPQGASVLTYDQCLKDILINCNLAVSSAEMPESAGLVMRLLQSQVCATQRRWPAEAAESCQFPVPARPDGRWPMLDEC